ncbi:uncharacterized protein LOC126055560 [Helicoverpa armigera]|uniref:uncharacterized protein LOC126055560 n=1 Tax=Helicoverpa armigera TaxID=29058 RepID=UPI003083C7C9
MRVLLLTLFVAAVTAVPIPEDSGSDAVEMIVNGLPEGAALDVSEIVDIKLNEHADGEIVAATNLLHPYTAVGIAEATAAAADAAAAVPSEVNVVDSSEPLISSPESVVLPSPAVPEVVPESVVLPSPALPEVIVPEPVVMPAPATPEVVPEPVVLPSPAVPEVVPEPIVLPAPAVPEVVIPEPVVVIPEPVVLPSPVKPEVVDHEQLPVPIPQVSADLFNDGLVQVQYNGPEPGMLATVQSWFNMIINYFNDSSDSINSAHF